MKTNFVISLLLLFMLTSCAQAAEEPIEINQNSPTIVEIGEEMVVSYLPEYHPGPCPFVLPEGMIENEDLSCGILTVPEDRSHPNNRDVELAVAVFHSPNQENLQPDPIVFVEGGPGAEVLSKLSLVFAKFSPLLKDRDLIFYDPRGVGFSSPSLDCPVYTEALFSALEQNLASVEAEQVGRKALADCGQRLIQEGINLSAYNLHENAADLDDMRTALGYEQWNLFSVSYGTRVVQELLRNSAQGIRSVVLDSAVSPEAEMLEEAPLNIHRSLSMLLSTCASDSACFAAYPNLEYQLSSLVDRLQTEPIETVLVNLISGENYGKVRADGSSLLSVVVTGLYSDQVIPYLPKLIADTAVDDFTLLSSLRSNQITGQVFISEGAYYAGVCHDEVPFNSLEHIEQNNSRFLLLDVLFSRSNGGKELYGLCTQWEIDTADSEVNSAVSSDLPVLILAGQFDPASPPVWGEQVAENMPHATFIEFPNTSHSVVLSHACPLGITLAFFDDPTSAPDTTCIDDIQMSFVTPAGLGEIILTPITVEETGIQAVVPENWIPTKSDYFVSPDQAYELVITKEHDTPLEDFLAAWGAVDPGTKFSTGSFDWQVYIIQRPEIGKIVFLAVSMEGDGFYMTLVVGPKDQAEAIRDYLFLPVLQAFSVGE